MAEKVIDLVAEVSIHWEISDDGEVVITDIFDQLAVDFSYAGTAHPSIVASEIKDKISQDLMEKFVPYLLSLNAKGYFCCDILVDLNGVVYWTDFNPRKGAIIYINDMAKRLSEVHLSGLQRYFFWHEHFSAKKKLSFKEVFDVLQEDLIPSCEKAFVVITNPGVIRHGGLDITGFSTTSLKEAKKIVQKSRGKFT
ncbi:MAG: hypothetical protein RLZZ230_735 [Candidatus Parcubacteria bacterium]